MKFHPFVLLMGLMLTLSSCFFAQPDLGSNIKKTEEKSTLGIVSKEIPIKDKSLDVIIRYFEQADAIHREAWWVLSEEKRSLGRSPFGKVQRALLSTQNVKLNNKSLFRCDRYEVKKEPEGGKSFPLRLEIFEKCSAKLPAKLMARLIAPDLHHLQVIFFPEGLEEVLGLGASVVNKLISCEFAGGDDGRLLSLNCKDWAQERTREQMIRLDTYEYARDSRNMIKLRGKVFENLTDTRTITADVPLDGRIEVLETELYPPPSEDSPKDEKVKISP